MYKLIISRNNSIEFILRMIGFDDLGKSEQKFDYITHCNINISNSIHIITSNPILLKLTYPNCNELPSKLPKPTIYPMASITELMAMCFSAAVMGVCLLHSGYMSRTKQSADGSLH